MLALVTTFKPFKNPFISMIQENAIKSWKMLNGISNIIVCGDGEGFDRICKKYNLTHEKNVECINNIPTINGLFLTGYKYKDNCNSICYTNGDVIYTQEWIDNIKSFRKSRIGTYPYFLLIGRRYDWMKPQIILFETLHDWMNDIFKNGEYHPKFGIEYMVFDSIETFFNEGCNAIPKLAVGSPGWDLLLLTNAIKCKMVVDLSNTTLHSVIHQEHPRTFHRDKGLNFNNNMKLYRKRLKEFRQKHGIIIDMNIANYESYYDENDKICFGKKENKLI